jgi:hypothetical protein
VATGIATRQREPRIAVLGSGPAGLAVAFHLKKRGYKEVMVLEKLGRVGGLCKSFTDGYAAFDLGGTYITPAYTETLKLARCVGAERYRGKTYKLARVVGRGRDKRLAWGNAWDYARNGFGPDDETVGRLKLVFGVFRFWWCWLSVRRYVNGPTFESVDENEDLCVSFQQWLDDHGIGFMGRMFEIPVTMMGYGFLHEVAAPYVLKYMSPGTYWSMFLRGLPLVGWFWAWPQRFREGFQRMWERIAAELDVRMDVEVLRVRRHADRELPIEVELQAQEGLFAHDDSPVRKRFHFDKLIIACPFTDDVLGRFFRRGEWSAEERNEVRAPWDQSTLSEEEKDLFRQIQPFDYVQTTLHAVRKRADGDDSRVEHPFRLKAPVVPVFPFNESTLGKPWVVVQVWGRQSRLLQFYSRVDERKRVSAREMQADVKKGVRELLDLMEGEEAGTVDARLRRWTTYDRWPYFGHVTPESIRNGFFRRLEAMQGRCDTYYTGGAATFEMVESIVRHAKHIAERVDADLQAEHFPVPRPIPLGPVLPRRVRWEELAPIGSEGEGVASSLGAEP